MNRCLECDSPLMDYERDDMDLQLCQVCRTEFIDMDNELYEPLDFNSDSDFDYYDYSEDLNDDI